MRIYAANLLALAVLMSPGLVSAHVAVTPAKVGIGSTTVFSASVPNESQQPMTNFALDVPAGVEEVTPTAKAGWVVTIAKTADVVTKITWADGSLQPGQRDDFTFSAQAPAKATQLSWKAYQIYADGAVTHWDQQPSASNDATGTSGPYSVTSVVNDLTNTSTKSSIPPTNHLTLALAGTALLLSVYSLLFKKRT